MRYADCHLHLLDSSIEQHFSAIISGAIESGVDTLVVQGSCENDWDKISALELPGDCPINLYKFYGLHPWFAETASCGWEDKLCHHLADDGNGIGEIGIDRYSNCNNFTKRLDIFARQLELAAQKSLPVSLHCIKTWDVFTEILNSADLPPAVHVHGLGCSAEIAEKLVELGCWISFAPSVCNPSHKKSREAVRVVPADKLLSESDCPDMPGPADFFPGELYNADGKLISQCSDIPATIAEMARLRGQDAEELAAAIYNNTQKYISFFPNVK